jgi:hypothetical protein
MLKPQDREVTANAMTLAKIDKVVSARDRVANTE